MMCPQVLKICSKVSYRYKYLRRHRMTAFRSFSCSFTLSFNFSIISSESSRSRFSSRMRATSYWKTKHKKIRDCLFHAVSIPKFGCFTNVMIQQQFWDTMTRNTESTYIWHFSGLLHSHANILMERKISFMIINMKVKITRQMPLQQGMKQKNK